MSSGEALRDDALKRVEKNASMSWMVEARDYVLRLAPGTEFTADDVWVALSNETHEPRALGAVMRKLSAIKAVVATGVYRASRLPRRHARPIMIWKRLDA